MKQILQHFLSACILLIATAVGAQSITITSPNGGEVWAGCTAKNITWSASGTSNFFSIDYSTDGGTNWTSVTSFYNTTGGSYAWTVPNINSSTCLVRIKDSNTPTIVDQSNSTFTITAPLILTSPNGSESWEAGTTKSITWAATGTANRYNLEYSTNGGSSWSTILSNHYNTSGIYNWTVPNNQTTTGLVRITDYYTACMTDKSDNIFTIAPPTPTLNLTSPNGGQTYYTGRAYTISWSSANLTSSLIALDYSTDSGNTWIPIVTGISNTGSHSWTVPNTVSNACLVKVKSVGTNLVDSSNNYFTIRNPYIQVTYPNGGENLEGCNSYTIRWAQGGIANYRFTIAYTLDNGASWTNIATNVYQTSSTNSGYTWSVPNTVQGTARIRVSDYNNSSTFDESNASFNLSKNTSVIVTSPVGGEQWEAGTSKTITWVDNNLSRFRVYYSSNGGSSWSYINSSTTANSQNWSVPNSPSANYLIRVDDYYNSCYSDQSDSTFTVTPPTPTITVTYPNGGNTFYPNESRSINWSSAYLTSGFVKTEYSTDSGATWIVNSSVTSNDGSDSWTVPNVLSTNYLVRVSEYGNPSLNDVSNAPFSVVAPYITLNSPNGGEVWKGCETKNISFSVGGGSGSYRLEYSTDSGSTWNLITTTSSTSYNWTLPAKLGSTNAFIRVRDISRGILDQSNSKFTIVPNTDIIVTSPNGGEQWEAGTSKQIDWVDNGVTYFRVYYSANGGSSYSYISSYTTANAINWSVPNNPGANYKIKVEDYYNSCKYDESDSIFTVLPPQPIITVTAPNSNTLYPLQSYNIRWSSQYLNSSFVNIDFSSDSGATWSSVVQTTANDGIHTWSVPSNVSANCFIRVTESGSPSVYDWSGKFTIAQPYLTLNSPNGGEVWKGCETKNISFSVGGGSGSYRLEYSLDSGSTWDLITTTSSTSYNWSLPTKISSAKGFVRVRDLSRSLVDQSNSKMTFVPNSDIIVTSPNGGEQWEVGLTKQLNWVDNGISYFRVYYSSNGGSSYSYISSYTTANAVNWSVPNNPGANYKIKVEDYYNSCVYDESDTLFTVIPPTPTITVTYPNGGNTFYPGENRSINWSSAYLTSGFVKTEYSADSGATWVVNSSVTSNDGSDPWPIPNVLSTNYLVRVSEYGNSSLNDVSNAPFSVVAPYITLNSPNGGEVWKGCETKNISFSVGGGSGSYRLEYSLDSGSTWNLITTTSSTSYNWTLPAKLGSTNAFIRVRDISRGILDQSNSKFTIVPNTDIIVTSPNGGEQWEAGTSKQINWVDNGVSRFRVYYSSNGGSSYSYLSSSTSANYFNWSIPNNPGTNYSIKIQDYYNSCIYDESDSLFTVLPPQPVIVATAPNGTTLYPQQSYNIRWTSAYLNSSFVKIEFSSDSGSTWSVIAASTSNDGIETWTVPNTISNNCFIRVSEVGSPSVNDWTGKFYIAQPYITLNSPNGGEVWKGCETKNINFTVGGGSGSYRLLYTVDSGSTWNFIVNTSSTSYNWKLPTKIEGNKGFIRVQDINHGLWDQSNSKMTFVPNSDIIVTSPTGGEQWEASTTKQINWVDNGISYFRVYYSSNSGSSYSYVTSYTTANAVNWSVPNNPGANYKIKVEDYYNSCVYDESDSVFEVTPPTPYLTLTYPNGANTLYQGQSISVRWNSGHLTSPYVRLDYSLDSGLTWSVISNITNNDGIETWVLPNVLTTQAMVRVSEYGNASMSDVSNAPFTIKPSITLLSPNGGNGQVDYRGCTVTSITWQAGGTSRYYYIDYSLNGGSTWTTLNSNYYNTSSIPVFNWTMPNSGSTNVVVRVRDKNDLSKGDQSDNPFAITLPIKLITPNNGETYYVGDTVMINWKSNGTSNYYNLDYSTNGGSTWNNIAFNFNTSGSTYQWIVPGTISNNALIRITDNISNCKQTQSAVPFKIVSGTKKIVVTQPSGGENWNGCTQQQIKWTDSGNSTAYKIEYSSNAGASWTTIQSSYGSASKIYNWTVPSQIGTNYLVRVSDASDATKTDQSDSTFEVGVVSAPTISAVGVTTICSGSSVTLTCDRSSGITWYPGALSTQSINVTTPGTYYVIATDSNSCSVQSNSILIKSGTPPTAPTITASGNTTFCLGGSVILSTNQTSGIKWYPGGQTSQTITVTQGASYTVSYTDSSSCTSTSSPMVVTTNAIPTITRSSNGACLGDTLTLISSSPTGNVWFPTADTSRSIKVWANGNYSVQVTDSSSCVSTSQTDTIQFQAAPSAPVVSANGSLSFCPGESVTLKASPTNNIKWSTGANDSILIVDTSKTVYAIYTNSSGCSSRSNDVNTTLLPAPAKPVISVIGSTSFCNGDSATLVSNTTNNTWSTNETSSAIVVKNTGSYLVTTTGGNGCTSTSDAKVISVNPIPNVPTISANGPTTFCAGDSVILSSGNASGNHWSNGDSSTSIVVKNAGNYSVSFTNQFGCSSASNNQTVVVNSAPVKPTISASNGTTICQGESTTLTSSFSGKNLWYSNDTTRSINVSSSSNLSVTAINSNGCSTSSDVTNVVVRNNPSTPTISLSDTGLLCSGDTVMLISSASQGNRWSTNDSSSTIKVYQSGTYSLKVVNQFGCESGIVSKTINIGNRPTKPSISATGNTTFCQGDSVVLTSSSSINNKWSNGAQTPSIVVKNSGNYWVEVQASSGCSSQSNSTSVVAHSAPSVPVISVTGNTTFCQGDSVVLTSNKNSGNTWSNSDTTASIVVNSSANIGLSYTDGNGCSSSASPVSITANPKPATPTISALGATTFCDGGNVVLSSNGLGRHLWNNSDTNTSITVSSSGVYNAQVTNAFGCSAKSNSISVTAFPFTPTPTVLVSGDSVLCQGDSVVLSTNLSTGLLWSNNAIGSSIKVGSSGIYYVTYTDTNGCSKTSRQQSVVVNTAPAAPSISANGPLSFCDGGSVLLSSSSGSNNHWSNNDTSVSITVSNSGSYSVTVENSFGCSKTSAPITVTRFNNPLKPQLIVTGDTVLCQGDSVVLSTGAGSGLSWSNGPSGTSQVIKVSGLYSVTKSDSNNCSSTSDQVRVIVNPKPAIPTISAGSATTFCAGGSVLLTSSASSGNIWSTNDTSNSLLVSNSGNYSVKVRNQFGCETSSINTSVTVHTNPSAPQLNLTGDSVLCAGDSAQLSTNYFSGLLWSHGDSLKTISISSSGNYSVTYTDGNGCSTTSRTQGIVVNPTPSIPSISNNGPLTFCQGGSVLLTSSSSSKNSWSTNDTSSSISVSSSGNYGVTVRNQYGCEASSANVFVKVNPLPAKPTLLVTGDTTFCQGDSAIIQSSYANNIVWSNADTNASVIARSSGFYSVTYTDTNNCSATSKSLRITSNPLPVVPTVTASGALTFCDGNSVTLNSSASSGNKWSRGDSSASILVTTSGNYSVTAYNQFGCSSSSANTLVQVNPLPTKPSITANGPVAFCQGDSVILGSSSLTGNQWSTTDTNRTIVVKSTGIYSLRIINQNGCQSPLENLSVTVNPIPNAPVISANGPIGFCQGDSVRLSSNSLNGNIWNNADTTQSTSVKTSGNYFVKLVNQYGCEAISNSIAVAVGSLPATPGINTIGNSVFCQGDSVTLVSTASLGNRWSNGDSSQSIVVKQPGKYTLRNLQNGCFSQDTSAFVTVNPNPVKPTITFTGNTTFCQGDSLQLFSSAITGNRWNSNDTTASITIKSTGQYSVEVLNQFGCKTASDPLLVNVKVNPATPAISLIGKSNLCLGDSVVLVSNGSTGNRWSTGDSSNSIVVRTPGTISLKTLQNGCYSGEAKQPIVVNSNPMAPSISYTGDTTFCPGDSVVLHSSYPSGNVWSGSISSNSLTVKQSGTYQVTYTDSNGCSAVSKVIGTTLFAAPTAPFVSPSGNLDLCEGDMVVLKSDVGSEIEWNFNQSRTDTLTVNTAGNYFVTFTDGNGCSITSNQVSVTILPAPAKPTVVQKALDLESSAASSYQWSFGGSPLAGAIGKSHRPQNNGVYQVSIADGNGCTATSDPFTFNAVGIEMVDLVESFKLYPNPSNGSFTMDLQMAQLKELEVVIYNLQGQVVHQESIKPTELFVKREYELQYLPSGIYHLELISDVGKYSGRLNINK